ncbi:nuclear speckle splicing regulatory protein 1 [Manduca sexta]|uniref:nuclear speckle splicing regulatory protein 1 n=1 Tax=Manduca sexta TaxID=7130 RepID=UPI00188FB012|nr:nuclear speckle splicing regulatory protein 1 [Manduca sexta]
MASNKKYGLILPDKTPQLTFQASRNVFGNDSDSEEEGKKPVLFKPNESRNRQAKISQEKAMLEDPTVYQYDEIYDEVINKKEKEMSKKKVEKKPMYIENLIISANKRKIENERRIERQIQKEREKEGDEFKDKEIFVTSAYKKKLEEMKLEEEKEKREEYLESIGDVTKQKDLGGFYRHLYEQKLGKDENPTAKKETNICTDRKENISTTEKIDKCEDLDKSKKRNYRKRKTSLENKGYLSDGELEDSDEEINRLNLDDIRMAKKHKKNDENIDADSDFSIDESSDDEADKKIDVNVNQNENEEEFKKPPIPDNSKKSTTDSDIKDVKIFETQITEVKEKPKIDIWKKRTVGVVFEEALKRYYERKAARGR